MSDLIRIELPWPDARLNPNKSKGMHWGSTSTLRKKARESAFWLTVSAMRTAGIGIVNSKAIAIPLTITFVQPDKRGRDRDNLLAALKPQIDGVADGIGANDCQFDPITIKREYGRKPGAVIVEIG